METIKPNFWNTAFNILSQLFSIVSVIIGLIIKSDNFGILGTTFLVIGIYITAFIISLIINNIIYTVRLCKLCSTLEENRKAVLSDNDKYIKRAKDANATLAIQYEIISNIINYLNAYSTEPNEYEKKCINALLENIYAKIHSLHRNGDD